MFRAELTRALAYSGSASQGRRPPFDPVLMFKALLVVQATNNLSDERAEFLINDRRCRSCGSWVWAWRIGFPRRARSGCSGKKLYTPRSERSSRCSTGSTRLYAEAGYIAMGGQIVDATLVAAPKQRNRDDEKKAIREGRIPEDWKGKAAKLRQKDRDARWTVKFSKAKERPDGTKPKVDIAIPTFGYQNHVLDRPPIRPDPPLGRDRRGGL